MPPNRPLALISTRESLLIGYSPSISSRMSTPCGADVEADDAADVDAVHLHRVALADAGRVGHAGADDVAAPEQRGVGHHAERDDDRGEPGDDEQAHPDLAVLAAGRRRRRKRLVGAHGSSSVSSSDCPRSTSCSAASAAAWRSAKARTTVSRAGAERRGRPDEAQLAVGEQGHPVGDLQGLLDVVRHDDRRDVAALADLQDQARDGGGVDRVEPRDRLVVEQDLGPAHDGAREPHALAHAARQLRRQLVQHERGVEVHVLERLAHLAQDLGRAGAPRLSVAQAGADVLEHVHRVEERRVLEHVAHLAADLGERVAPRLVHGHAVDPDVAPVGHQQAVRGLEQHALAGARGTHDRERLARLDREVRPR